jgi:two-component system, NarL family, sensor kinase
MVAGHYASGGRGGHHEGMTATRRPALVATALFALTAAEAVTAYVAAVAATVSVSELNQLLVFSNANLGLALALAGWPVAAYRPDIRVGWLLLGGGITYASTGAGIALLATVDENPFWRLVATVVNGGWTWAITFFLPLALLLFPNGRLPGRRWRWLVVVMAVNGPLFYLLGVTSGLSREVGVRGYLDLPPDTPALAPLGAASAAATVLSIVGSLVAVVVRFRRGSERVRRQLLWVMLAVLVVVVIFALDPWLPDSFFSIYPIALIPLAILVAVFRYQLFDIRLVFSRSVIYLVLTGATVGAYLAIVALLGSVAPLGASVVATLAVAAAFNPLRVWLQRRVDRLVYGARRDPVRALAEVGARLGEVGAVTGAGLDAVLRALCDVMRLPAATIVAHGAQLARHGEPPAALRAVALRHGDERIGELVVGLRSGESTLDSADERVLELLAAPIAVAVHATRLADDLARSREQAISGREEERRRMRRDLHDGLGPVLTGVVLNAEAALRLVRSDPDRSEELLTELRNRTTGALDEIRRLVYGLRPPALDSLGLVGALQEYAMVVSRRADAAPLSVSIDAPAPLGELPAAVEVAAYRIVTEALTNVTRHSNASSAVATLAVEHGELRVSVHDDGVNVGGGWQPGVGLTSIRERAAELGGRCAIRLDRTGGRVDVFLPIVVRAAVEAS